MKILYGKMIMKIGLCSIFLTMSLVAQEITTFFGTFDVQEPVLLELIESKTMQRLKYIEQSGIGAFVRDPYSFTRYDHSIAVCLLCRKFGATLEEQVAALLHDASHTVFSHVGDIIFDHKGIDAYQDEIHEWYIKQTDAYDILQRYGIADVVSDEAKDHFTLLEQDLPDLCADRLEYNLDVGLHEGLISIDDALYILAHIRYTEGKWYFDDQHAACQFGLLTVTLTNNLWGSVWDGFINSHAAALFKYAVKSGVLTADEIHFGVDRDVWQKLHAVNDPVINSFLRQLKTYDDAYTIAEDESYDYYYKPKCRAVDPWLLSGDQFIRLSEVDDLYRVAYQQLKEHCKFGWYLKITRETDKN